MSALSYVLSYILSHIFSHINTAYATMVITDAELVLEVVNSGIF